MMTSSRMRTAVGIRKTPTLEHIPLSSNRPKIRYFLGGVITGIIICTINFILSLSPSDSISTVIGPPVTVTVKGGTGSLDVAGKYERMLKYVNTYRYIAHAPRYDFINFPENECGSGPGFHAWFQQGWQKRSHAQEDKIIYETFFMDKQPFEGTYVELGAFDGMVNSNTRFFDNCLGWKGLLLEGNPMMYQMVIENRPFAGKMSVAPSCSAEHEAVHRTVAFHRKNKLEAGLVGDAMFYKDDKEITNVPCGPMSPILEDIFYSSEKTKPTVDFFSLDVEGSEDDVLATIDFKKVRINILLIEIENEFCKTNKCEVRKNVRAKMTEEGYKQYRDFIEFSDVYVHPESPYQIPESVARPYTERNSH